MGGYNLWWWGCCVQSRKVPLLCDFCALFSSLSLSLSLCELHVGSVGCVSVSLVRRATVFSSFLGKLFKF